MQRSLPRLRDERHRRPRAARRARRAQAGAPPGALRDVRRRLPARPRLRQVRPRRRRRHGQLPPARRHRDLRRPGPAGPAVVAALPAGRRPGQLRLARATTRRPPCATPSAGWRRWPWRCCGTSTRTPSTSSPNYDGRTAGADRPARPLPEPAGQRLGRHRGRHGHQHPAAQPARGRRRRAVVPASTPRPPHEELLEALHRADQGPGLPDRRADRRPRRHRGRLPHRPRLDHACAPSSRSRRSRAAPAWSSPSCPTRSTRTTWPQKIAELVKDGKIAGIADIARRVLRPHRPAPGHRAQARRGRQGRAEQPLQAHPAAGQLRRQHAGASSTACRARCASTQFIRYYVDHQIEVIVRRTRFRLRKAEERAHILRGSAQGARRARRGHRADPARRRPSTTPASGLMELLDIDEIQANAILDMQLRRLAALERQQIIDELAELEAEIAELQRRSWPAPERQRADRRRGADRDRRASTATSGAPRSIPFDGDMSIEDLIAEEDVVVTITRGGYAKRTKTDLYRSQKRGGKGVRGAQLQAGRHRRALLRHHHAPLDAVLHQQGPGLPGQGVRAAGGRPRRPRPARGEPAGLPAGREDRPGHRHPRLRASRRTWCWPPSSGLVKKTALTRLRLAAHRRRHRDQPARGRRADRRRAVSPPTTTCCWSRARRSRSGSHADRRGAAADGPGHLRRDRHALPRRRRAAGDGRRRARTRYVLVTATDGGYAKRTADRRVPGPGPRRQGRHRGQDRRGPRRAGRRADRRGTSDEVYAITSGGGVIRTRVAEVRETGRDTMGVQLINLGERRRRGRRSPATPRPRGTKTSSPTPTAPMHPRSVSRRWKPPSLTKSVMMGRMCRLRRTMSPTTLTSPATTRARRRRDDRGVEYGPGSGGGQPTAVPRACPASPASRPGQRRRGHRAV